MTGVPSIPRSFASNPANLRGRSQPPSSDVSSYLLRPKWHRLVMAVASVLASRTEADDDSHCVDTADTFCSMFIHPDAVGGGTERDLRTCLTGWLEVLDLEDSDTGFVLLHAYHFLQTDDLPLSSRTWRPLMVTCILLAVEVVLGCTARDKEAKVKLQQHVAHWWSGPLAEGALRACSRHISLGGRRDLSRSALAMLYFELRERALHMHDEEDASGASATFLSDSLAPLLPAPLSVAHGSSIQSKTGGSLDSSLRCSQASSDSDLHGDEEARQKEAIIKPRRIISL